MWSRQDDGQGQGGFTKEVALRLKPEWGDDPEAPSLRGEPELGYSRVSSHQRISTLQPADPRLGR